MAPYSASFTTLLPFGIVSKARLTVPRLLQRSVMISVSLKLAFDTCLCLSMGKVWYTEWKNRGYLSPEALGKMPIVEERWKELSKQLRVYKTQSFDKQKK